MSSKPNPKYLASGKSNTRKKALPTKPNNQIAATHTLATNAAAHTLATNAAAHTLATKEASTQASKTE